MVEPTTGHAVAAAIGAAVAAVLDALRRWRTSSHDLERDDRDQLRDDRDELRQEWEELRREVKKDLRACRRERAELDAELEGMRLEVGGLRREVSRLKMLVNYYEALHGNLPDEEAIALGLADSVLQVRHDDVDGEHGEPST